MKLTNCVAAFAALSSFAAAASAAPVCHRLDVPGSTWTQLWQVNSAGQVAAGSDIGGAIYSGGVWTTLPAPAGSSGYTQAGLNALGINDSGVIAGGGYNQATGLESGFILSGNDYSFFAGGYDPVSYPDTEARAIANNGVVTGWVHDVNNSSGVGFIYNPGAPVAGYAAGFTPVLPTLNGQRAFLTIPGTMNDAGVFVGSAQFAGHGRYGFIFDPSSASPISTFRFGNLPTSARGINNSGTIVGFVRLASGDTTIFVRSPGGAYTTLPCADLLASGGSGLYAESINESGVISGGFHDAAGNIHGLLIYPEVVLPVSGFTYSTPVAGGTPIFFGSTLADGYVYATAAGNPNFASVTLPIGVGKNVYTIIVHGQAVTVPAGEKFDFAGNGFAGGVASFKVLGVDPAADAVNGPAAFVSEISFAGSGQFTGTIRPMDTAAEIADLQAAVSDAGPGKSLAAKLGVVQKDYAAGDTAGACSVLGAFVSEVSAQSGKSLPASLAGAFTAEARDLAEDVGCK